MSKKKIQMSKIPKSILFIGALNENGNEFRKSIAIDKLVDHVDFIDTEQYINPSNKIRYWLTFHYQYSVFLDKLNQAILSQLQEQKYDLVWFEKPIFIYSETLEYIRSKNIVSVSYNPDNAFGPRKDGCWRLYLENLDLFSHHLIPRRSNYHDIRSRSTAKIFFMPFSFDQNIHFKESNLKKDLDVTFIGTPHDQRIEFLYELSKNSSVNINIFSAEWRKFEAKLSKNSNVNINNSIYGIDYREVINRSRIMLGFMTQSNFDEYSRRSFEISACGSFLLSQRSNFQKRFFRENKEAVYFDDVSECADKINYFLDHPEQRRAIEISGYRRVKELNFNNDYLLKRILNKIF